MRVLRKTVSDYTAAGSSCESELRLRSNWRLRARTSDDNVVVSLRKGSRVGVQRRKGRADTKSKRKSTRSSPAHDRQSQENECRGLRERK